MEEKDIEITAEMLAAGSKIIDFELGDFLIDGSCRSPDQIAVMVYTAMRQLEAERTERTVSRAA